jgi:FAD binding domain
MDRGASEDVPVLIVGGSLVGLSAALFLRGHGVDVLAVERHAGTAINARAGHFHLRTVEILRSAGLEDAVRRMSEEQYPPDGGINNVESLAGREIANYFPNLNAGVDEFSPTARLFINQDALEPILRTRAAELGARLRYRTECTSLEAAVHAGPVRPELRAAGRPGGRGLEGRGADRSEGARSCPGCLCGGERRSSRRRGQFPRFVRYLTVWGRAGATGRFRGLAGRDRSRCT